MKRTVFFVIRNTREIKIPLKMGFEDAVAELVYPGCTTDFDGDQWPEEVSRHATKEEAIAALKLCGKSDVNYYKHTLRYIEVEEYYVEEYEVETDEDGDVIEECPCVVWEYSPMPSEVWLNSRVFRWIPDAINSRYGKGAYALVEDKEE